MTEFELSANEEQIIDLVTRAFPDEMLRAFPIDIETLEGREWATLRFTLNDAISTDIKRYRAAEEPAEDLAREVVEDLRRQSGVLR